MRHEAPNTKFQSPTLISKLQCSVEAVDQTRMMSHRSSFFSQVFDGFVAEFSAHIAGWKEVFDSDDPLNAEWPNNFKVKCNPLQRALTMFAIRTDATVLAVQKIVETKLGTEYLMVASGTVSGWFLVRGRTSIFVCTVLLVKMLD